MGLMFDLAVAAIALLVVGSLALLAWTLGVAAVRAARQGRRRIAHVRFVVAEAETRLRFSAAGTTATLARLVARTTPPKPGDGPDA